MKMIIVGCGLIGSGLAQQLSRSGHTVTVIDSDPEAFKKLGPSFRGETIEGIGFDKEVLLRAKVDRVDALAAVTSSDEANAVVARLAREVYRVPKVVARMYNKQKAEIYKRLGVETISSTTWGIKRAAELLCYSPLNSVLSLGEGDADIVEMLVPSLLIGHRVQELTAMGEIHVVAITRANKTFLPTLGTTFEKDDLVYLAVATASIGRLKRLLGME
ncbi:MAG: TrkA family potassium uptake protein [Bacillota bacterium]